MFLGCVHLYLKLTSPKAMVWRHCFRNSWLPDSFGQFQTQLIYLPDVGRSG